METKEVMIRRDKAIEIAREASSLLLEYYGQLDQLERNWKGLTDFKTEADDASEKLIYSFIRESFPNDSFVAEEGTKTIGKNKFQWIIDPLDGTVEFCLGLNPYAYAVSIGVAMDNVPVVSVISIPGRNEVYYSHPEGAFCNNEPIHVAAPDETAHAILLLHGGKEKPNKLRVSAMQHRITNEVLTIPYFGSAATCLTLVASGRVHGYVGIGMDPWDLAGGVPIVLSAGGKATTPDGNDWKFGDTSVVVAHSAFHDWILNEVNK